MLILLLACTAPADDTSPTDTDTGEPTDTDSGDTGDTGDVGDEPHTHYMCTITGTTTLSGGSGSACAGEAHVNVYEADGRLLGYASCPTDDDAELLAGSVDGAVVDGILTATWTADVGDGAIDIGVTGTGDGAALHADLAGTADWASFVGALEGTAL